MLWRCWLGGRKGIRPVKAEWWGAGVVICLQRGADLHVAQQIPLPLTVSCFSKIQTGLSFLVPAHPGSPGQRAVKRVCVCVCVCVCVLTARRPCKAGRRCCMSRAAQRCACVSAGDISPPRFSLLHNNNHQTGFPISLLQKIWGLFQDFPGSQKHFLRTLS